MTHTQIKRVVFLEKTSESSEVDGSIDDDSHQNDKTKNEMIDNEIIQKEVCELSQTKKKRLNEKLKDDDERKNITFWEFLGTLKDSLCEELKGIGEWFINLLSFEFHVDFKWNLTIIVLITLICFGYIIDEFTE